MKTFAGFPARAQVTPLPNLFFTQLLPQIDDLAELKITLHLFWLLQHRKGYPRLVTYRELLGDATLMQSLGTSAALEQGLRRAVQRGTLLALTLSRGEQKEEVYLLNTEGDRQAAQHLKGETFPLSIAPQPEVSAPVGPKPNIFTLYEENIGLVTPLLADELQEAEKLYPPAWIEEAFKEAVDHNKRNWRYISRILERWAREGKGHGKPGRDSKEEADRDKYIRGRYGHLVRR